jgi:hypothetical protein
MDPTSLATALVSAQASQVQIGFAAKMMKMNADQQSSIAQMVSAAAQSSGKLSNLGAGIGQNLDIAA